MHTFNRRLRHLAKRRLFIGKKNSVRTLTFAFWNISCCWCCCFYQSGSRIYHKLFQMRIIPLYFSYQFYGFLFYKIIVSYCIEIDFSCLSFIVLQLEAFVVYILIIVFLFNDHFRRKSTITIKILQL